MFGISVSLVGFFIALYGALTCHEDKRGTLTLWAMVFVFGCLTTKYIVETIGIGG